jgi:hypothetical protein
MAPGAFHPCEKYSLEKYLASLESFFPVTNTLAYFSTVFLCLDIWMPTLLENFTFCKLDRLKESAKNVYIYKTAVALVC